MAHEIKRPLAGIRGAIELIEQEYAISDPERRLLGQVENELTHVDETLRDLLSLAKPVGLQKREVSVPETIDAALMRLSGLPGADAAKVERDYNGAAPRISADGSRLEQAFLNRTAGGCGWRARSGRGRRSTWHCR